MLKILRNKKTAKKIWIGLALIIIPAFALWGFGGQGDKEESAVAGRIFGKNVSALEFKNALAASRTMAIIQFGDQLPEIERFMNFEAQAWERLILLHEAKRRRIRVTDKEVVEEIQNAPYFHDSKGFSNKAYQEVLRYVLRLQPRIFEEQTRQNLILSKLYDQVTKNIKLNAKQIHQEYLKTNEELSIEYIRSLIADFEKSIRPTEQEITEYFQQNKIMFKEPAANGQPVRIPQLNEIKEKIKDALIKQLAKDAALNKIKECAEKIKTLGFNPAASACGLKSGNTDFFKSTGLIKDLGVARVFYNSAKELKINETSGVIANDQGYYLIKLKATRSVDENKFLQEKEAFAERLLSTKRNEAFSEFAEQLKKKAQ